MSKRRGRGRWRRWQVVRNLLMYAPTEMWVGIDLLGDGNFPRPRAELDKIVATWFGDVLWNVTEPCSNNVLHPCT